MRRAAAVAVRFLAGVALGLAVTAAGVWGVPRAVVAVQGHPYFSVREIVLRGNHALQRDTILGVANLAPGMSIWHVSPSQVSQDIETLARVRRARVRREFPNRVIVELAEREAVAIAVVGGLHYLDRSGRVLGPLRQGEPLDLPFLTGVDGSHLQGSGVPMLRRALRLLRLCERRQCGGGVSEVHLDPIRGLILVPRNVPIPVLMGVGSWSKKLDRLERVLTAWSGQESHLASVDLTFDHSAVVKLRTEPRGAASRPPSGGLSI